MNGNKAVKEFMLVIALGFAAYIPLVCVCYLIARRLSLPVFLGAVWGSAVMLLYYFLFARATAKAASDEPEAAKKRIHASYSQRMLMIVVLIGAGVFFSTDFAPVKIFEWLPIVISMLIPRISIAVWQIVNKKKETGNGSEKESDE